MAVRTTVVTGQIINPLTGRVVANKRLSVRLNPSVVYSSDGTQQIIRSSWITTDATGNFSEAFGVNADLDPAGSYYTVQVAPGLIDTLVVPYSAIPVTYRSCLVSNPANPNPIIAGASVAQLNAETARAQGVEALKADLVAGLVPRTQLPNISGSYAVAVANQAAMLAIVPPDADTLVIAIRSDTPGTQWVLNPGLAAGTLGNWIQAPADASGAAAAAQAAAVATASADATAKVNTAVTGLINGAPGALDTLKELADAMGDDANFAATMTNALASKAPLAGPALTGAPTVNGRAVTVVPTENIIYVSKAANASDANDGLTWGSAKATGPAAVTALVALTGGSGVIQFGYGVFTSSKIVRPANCVIRGLGANLTTVGLSAGQNSNTIEDASWGSTTAIGDMGGVEKLSINGNKAGQTHVAAQALITTTINLSSSPITVYVNDATDFNTHGYTSGSLWIGNYRCNFTGLTNTGVAFDPANPTTTGWQFTGVTSVDGTSKTYYSEALVLPGAQWGHGIAYQSSRTVTEDVLIFNCVGSGRAYQATNGFSGPAVYENKGRNIRVQQCNRWNLEVNPGATDGMEHMLVGGNCALGDVLIMAANWQIEEYHPGGIFSTSWNARNAAAVVVICAPMVRIDGHFDLAPYSIASINLAWCQVVITAIRLKGDTNGAPAAGSGVANAVTFYGQPEPGTLTAVDCHFDLAVRGRFLHALTFQPTTETVLASGTVTTPASNGTPINLQVLNALPFSPLGSAIAGTLSILSQAGVTLDTASYTGKTSWATGVATAAAIGATSLVVEDASGFAAAGTVAVMPQSVSEGTVAPDYVTYTGKSGNTLTGIPATGTGSIPEALPVGAGMAQHFITGVLSTGAGGVSIPDASVLQQAGGARSRRIGTARGDAVFHNAYHRRGGALTFPSNISTLAFRTSGTGVNEAPNPFLGIITVPSGSSSATVAHNLPTTPTFVLAAPKGDPQQRWWWTADSANVTVTLASAAVTSAAVFHVQAFYTPA